MSSGALIFPGLLSRNRCQVPLPRKPAIYIPFYDLRFRKKTKHITPLNGFIVILNSFEGARRASHLTLPRLGSIMGAQSWILIELLSMCWNFLWTCLSRVKRASCGSHRLASFLWLNHQVKCLPGFTDQLITEYTPLNTSHYKMLPLRDLQGQRLQRTKAFASSSRPLLSEGKGEIHQHYGNPCLSCLKLRWNRLNVCGWHTPNFCIRLCDSHSILPLFNIWMSSELAEQQCTVGSHSTSMKCPLIADLPSIRLPGHFAIRGGVRILGWK